MKRSTTAAVTSLFAVALLIGCSAAPDGTEEPTGSESSALRPPGSSGGVNPEPPPTYQNCATVCQQAGSCLFPCMLFGDLSSCGAAGMCLGVKKQPDLIAMQASGGCVPEIAVEVTNQGNAPAGPTTTVVHFYDVDGALLGTQSFPTASVAAGASVRIPVAAPPPGCYEVDCHLTVTADAANAVLESNESNNTQGGICLG